MSRKLEEIRKGIAKRKLNKRFTSHERPHSYGSLLDDEERFGYTSHPKADNERMGSIRTTLFPKLLMSIIIFFIIFFVYNGQASVFSNAKPYVQQVLTEDLPFATVQAWYEEHFATPFVLFGRDADRVYSDTYNSIPVNGIEANHVRNYEDGVYIEVTESKNVYPMSRGTVLFAGKKRDTGNTIILQHENGQKSVYGHLKTIDVFHYQFVHPNKAIGTVEPDELAGFTNMYFAVQDGSQYIDPLNIIIGDQNEE
ncbi:peptidoglycan DD-metalloendopeptidase family protein [Bacillaceae bacterium W0354]